MKIIERKMFLRVFSLILILAIFFVAAFSQGIVRAGSSYDPWDHDGDPKTPDADTDGWIVSGSIMLEEDLYFDGDGLTIDADGSNLDLNGHCIIGTGSGSGIKLVDSAGVTVSGGEVSNFGTGIYFENSHDVFVSDMLVKENEFGFYLIFSWSNKIDSNVVQENNIGLWAGACDQNAIRGNLVEDSTQDGIQLISCSNNLIGGNCIENNGRHGIKIEGGAGTSSAGNQVISNSLYKNINGVYLMNNAESNRIESNSISKNEFGIQFDASVLDPLDNLVRGNVICKNDVGVRFADKPHNNRATLNSIFDNDDWDVLSNSETFARFNWWGDEEGPIPGEDVSESVLYTPWLERQTIG